MASSEERVKLYIEVAFVLPNGTVDDTFLCKVTEQDEFVLLHPPESESQGVCIRLSKDDIGELYHNFVCNE